MIAKFTKLFAALGLVAAISAVTLIPNSASAGSTYCVRGVGGALYCK